MNNINIKKITTDLNELIELQKIARKTFYDTFKGTTSDADMESFLEIAYSVETLKNEIKNENSEYYFATLKLDESEKQEIVAGYIKVNVGDAQTEIQDKEGFEIQRIYVLEDYQRMKVGQLLFNKALELAKSKNGIEYIWLGVNEANHRALSFYKKNGFEIFGEHVFMLGDDKQTDLMMKLKLK